MGKITGTVYQLNFYHDLSPEREHVPDELKTFGFFDRLVVQELKGEKSLARGPVAAGRASHHRTLLVYGNKRAIDATVAKAKSRPCYLAVVLIKLRGKHAHSGYSKTLKSVLKRKKLNGPLQKTVFLGCLDAADLVALKVFEPKRSRAPLDAMFRWIEALRVMKPKGAIGRSLTIVACKSAQMFWELARHDPTSASRVQAAVRISDLDGGNGIIRLGKFLREKAKTDKDFEVPLLQLADGAGAGYYDAQLMLPVPIAGKLLAALENKDGGPELAESLRTSTMFFGPQKLSRETSKQPEEPRTLLESMREAVASLKATLDIVGGKGWLDHDLTATVENVLNRFTTRYSKGQSPGSRLLLWAARDAVLQLNVLLEAHLQTATSSNYPPRSGAAASGSNTDNLESLVAWQREFREFFTKIGEELDRRVSLSLAAHTRHFPCAIEAPLKATAALDLLGRLLAASFRSYRCQNQNPGHLPILTAKDGVWPSAFTIQTPKANRRHVELSPVIVYLTLAPKVIQRFRLAAFLVCHEAAQATLRRLLATPSFTSIHFIEAWLDHLTHVSILALEAEGTISDRYQEQTFPDLRELCTGVYRERVDATGLTRRAHKQYPEGWKNFLGENLDTATGDATPYDPLTRITHEVGLDGARTEAEAKRLFDTSILSGERIWTRPDSDEDTELANSIALRFGRVFGASSKSGTTTKRPGTGSVELRAKYILECLNETPELEFLELASIIPFLRAFHSRGDSLPQVMRGLLEDYCDVWGEGEHPMQAAVIGRRFAVALAAARVSSSLSTYRSAKDHRSTDLKPQIVRQIAQAARDLAPAVGNPGNSMMKRSLLGVFNLLQNDSRASNLDSALRKRLKLIAEQRLIIGLTLFLLGLLQTYSSDGAHVSDGKAEPLRRFDLKLMRLFLATKDGGVPVHEINRLWELQYLLTDTAQHSCDFSLTDAFQVWDAR